MGCFSKSARPFFFRVAGLRALRRSMLERLAKAARGVAPAAINRASRAPGEPSPVLFESLESRVLLSVSASTLIGPMLQPGTQAIYGAGGFGNVPINTVGVGAFNGQSATEIDSTVTTTAPTSFGGTGTATVVLHNQTYFALTGAGLVAYGQNISGAYPGAFGGTVNQTITDTLSPYGLVLPATMVPGQTYTDTYQASINPGPDTVQIVLVSGTTQAVTVPAGTFNAYQIDTTDTSTDSSGGVSTTHAQDFYAPGIGFIQGDGPLYGLLGGAVLISTNALRMW